MIDLGAVVRGVAVGWTFILTCMIMVSCKTMIVGRRVWRSELIQNDIDHSCGADVYFEHLDYVGRTVNRLVWGGILYVALTTLGCAHTLKNNYTSINELGLFCVIDIAYSLFVVRFAYKLTKADWVYYVCWFVLIACVYSGLLYVIGSR